MDTRTHDGTVHPTEECTVTTSDVAAGLGAKLDALDLTPEEHALLADLIKPQGGDDDAEVAGFNHSFTSMLSGVGLNIGLRPTLPGTIVSGDGSV